MSDVQKGDYFIWSTNCMPHKNHLAALRALEEYYSEGGNLFCLVTGVDTAFLSPKVKLSAELAGNDYIAKIRRYIKESDSLKKYLKFKGNMPKEKYYRTLAKARFVFHPGYGDNGNFTVTDAASLGVPALCSDYPAMRYLADFVGIPARYTEPFSARAMAEALLDMEKNAAAYADELPAREELRSRSYKYQSGVIYTMVKRMVGV